ncbi:kinase-like domain-containing protein [Irpex rosettiformis]|uniref:Kinase-like domain-containing protein n=1 Tax=Irpex rosettiformis TaxID=378272 RepID=A0ACB8U0E4_9APHY|nr:kinase-like domain-containing protein [Irpex rosettiformis]
MSDSEDLFNYTSGRWIVNNDLRLSERRREFDVDELWRLAAQSVGRSSQDIKTFVKLAEGGFNRIFLITMHDGFEMVARIPYPITAPKFYAIASEVATMRFLRSSGLPVPEVYDYSPSSDNAAKTEYIFMEFMRGTKLSDVWMELEESDIASVLRQLVQLESRMMSIPFPAGGSLYYTDDLEKVVGRTSTGVALNDERFCIGPDVRLHMWFGRRSQLDVNRGPYKSAEAALVAAARKELAYLERFGRPLQPFQRERREYYEFKEQSPSDHIENLQRYLRIAPLFVPKDPVLHTPCIRHPDLQPSNIIVSRSSDSNRLEIMGLIDWQHASILPVFLMAGIPGRLQFYDDPVSQALIPPSLPTNMNELDEDEKSQEMGLYHRRLVHFHYVKNTEKYNKLHYDAFSDPLSMFICRLFTQAGYPWEGETHELKVSLIEATEIWKKLKGEGVLCPVVFSPDDVCKTKELSSKLQTADENFEGCRGMIGFESETWVPNEHYKMAMALAELLKLKLLMALPKGELRDKIEANWFLDDMDEKDYM